MSFFDKLKKKFSFSQDEEKPAEKEQAIVPVKKEESLAEKKSVPPPIPPSPAIPKEEPKKPVFEEKKEVPKVEKETPIAPKAEENVAKEPEEESFWSGWFSADKPKEEKEKVFKEDLEDGLEKSKQGIFEKFTKAVAGKSEVDEDLLDDIEQILVSSDVGIETTVKIIDRLEEKVANEKYFTTKELYKMVKSVVVELMTENNTQNIPDFEFPDKKPYPYVVLVVGVNGVGKTTTIGKLAAKAKAQGKKVVLGAGDTFRAAAISQLQVWGERVGVPVVATQMGADPASVAFAAVEKAMEIQADVVFIDTAGRLHNKVGLMNELTKIKRVMQKIVPEVPHDVLLVLDGSTGQNAMEQAKQFTAATDVTCLAITKLDGSAKGGVVLGIADQFSIPIRYVGVGEQVHQLQLFNKENFVNGLFE